MPFYKSLTVVSLLTLSAFSLAQSTSEETSTEISPELKAVVETIAKENSERKASVATVEMPVAQPAVRGDLQTVIDEIVKDNAGKVDRSQAIARDVLDRSQGKAKLNSTDIENALAAPDYAKFGKGGEYGDDSAMSAAMAEAEQQAQQGKETRYGEDIYAYIAVSMSMPEQWFRQMLASLSNTHKDKRVVLALQGAKPGEFAKLALALEQAMPDGNEGSYAIVIDPTIFMRLEVTKVPTFAIRTEKGWRKVLGEMSLTQAEVYAAQDYDVFEALGRTYDIEEPNMITLLQEKMQQQIEQEDPVNAMRKKVQASTPATVNIPVAEESYSYLVTPIFTVEQDLAFEGTVFARKGDTINTLEHLPLTGKYAFIDLSDPAQVALARAWKSQHSNMRVFSTTMPAATALGPFIQEFGYISQVNSLLVERFHIEAMPALAYQVGHQLKIDVETPPTHLVKE